MNPIDKATMGAIWKRERTGNRAIDYFAEELRRMKLLPLILLYIEGKAVRCFVRVEILRRLFPFRR